MSLVTRGAKGSKLTIQEMDGNLEYLQSLTQNSAQTLATESSYMYNGEELITGDNYYGMIEKGGKFLHFVSMRKKGEVFPNTGLSTTWYGGGGWYVGVFEENDNKLDLKAVINIAEEFPINDYFNYNGIIQIDINSGVNGSGYTTGTYNLLNGNGSGGKIEITGVGDSGEISSWSFDPYIGGNGGSGYHVGDVLTVEGGNEDAEFVVISIDEGDWPNFACFTQATNEGMKFFFFDKNFPFDVRANNAYFYFTVNVNSDGTVPGTYTLHSERKLEDDPTSIEDLLSDYGTYSELDFRRFDPLTFGESQTFGRIDKWLFVLRNSNTNKLSFFTYDFVLDQIDVLIGDVEQWWNANASIPWLKFIEYSQEERAPYFSWVVPHPDRPMLIAEYGEDYNESGQWIPNKGYLIETNPNRFTDLDLTINDWFSIMFTQNKVYFVETIGI
jgi:hypothetical protein